MVRVDSNGSVSHIDNNKFHNFDLHLGPFRMMKLMLKADIASVLVVNLLAHHISL